MTKFVPARLLGGLLCAATVFAVPAATFAMDDEPAPIADDASDAEMMPPNSGDEGRADREARSEERSDAAPPATEEAPSPPPPSNRVERVDREAAKRALLSDPKQEKPNPLLDSRGPDYYDRRAKELLAADRDKGSVALHPLMEAHPDSFVVVCTGGCPTGRAQIVSMRPKPAPAPAPVQPAAVGSDQISCVGGCGPDGPKSLASMPQSTAVAATVGEWMTTVAKVPAGTETPAPKAAGSGDWMEKINRERDAAKAAAQQIATPAAPVETKPAVAEAKPVLDTKPTAPVETKPAVAEAKPVIDTKPTAPVETKPAVAEVKPVIDTKPAAPVETKPAIAEAKPVIDAKPAAPVETKPAVAEVKPVIDTKPAAPVETKPAIAEAKPVIAAPATPTPQKMATLETPKADPAPTPVKPAAPEQPAAIAKSGEVTAPASATTGEKAADVKPAAPQETKVAALEQPAVQKPAPVAPSAPKERVISVLSEDKEMNAAIEKARGSLAAFWKSFEQPGAGEADHALKVAIPGNGTTEHFWLTRIKREGGKLSGVISNQPQSVKTVKIGQRYEFTNDMISDWTFKRNGKLVGNETMRVLLPRMPEEQASVYRQMYETP